MGRVAIISGSQLTKHGFWNCLQVSNGACMPTRTMFFRVQNSDAGGAPRLKLQRIARTRSLTASVRFRYERPAGSRLRPPGPVMPFVWLDFLCFSLALVQCPAARGIELTMEWK